MLNHMILFLLFAFALVLCQVDPCKFTAFQPTTIDKVLECYSTISEDLDEIKRTTVENIQKYIDVNVFSEYYLNTDYSHMSASIDIKAEMQKILEKNHTNEYDFHWDIVQLMLSLKDPHSVYRFPTCFTRVYYSLPFGFNSFVDEVDQHLVLSYLPPDYSFVTIFYQSNEDGIYEGTEELIRAVKEGLEVQEMKITYDHDHYDLSFGDISGPAMSVMKTWADRHVYISRNSGARFNSALRSDFFLHASDYGIPFYQVQIKVGGVWFEVPWIAVPSQTIGGQQDLMNICPLKEPSLKSNNGVGGSESDLVEIFEQIKRSATERMTKSMHEKPPTPRSTTRTNRHSGSESEKMESRFVDFQAKADDIDTSDLTRIYIGDNILLYLYSYDTESTEIAVNSKFSAYVISIPSFSPNVYDQFVSDLQQILDYIFANTTKENTTIIIDVRENGGGYVDLGNKLLYYLVEPEVDSNSSGFYMRKKCLINEFMAKNELMSQLDGEDGLYDYYSHSILNSDDFYNSGDEFNLDFGNGVEASYMSGYTFSPLDFYDYSGQRRSDKGDTYNSNLKLKYYFDINDSLNSLDPTRYSILVITDGTCGSTCATFLSHAMEVNAVTVIGVGGYYGTYAESEEPLASSSFAGGSVLDSVSFEEFFEYFGVTSDDDQCIPNQMPRNNYIRFPYNALMSFRDSTVALEFEELPVSISVPYFTPLNLSVTDSMRDMLDFVIPRILSTDGGNSDANTNDNYIVDTNGCADLGVANSRGGYFYNPMIRDFEVTCHVVGCEAGYYPVYEDSANGAMPLMERAIIECRQLEETETPVGDLGWVSILCICLAIAICIFVLVFWLIRRKQGKRFGDHGFTKACCCPCCIRKAKADVGETDDSISNALEHVESSETSQNEKSSKQLLDERD